MVHAVMQALDIGGTSLRIRELKFELLSDDVIRAQSAVAVDNVIMYTRGLPSNGGVNDLRMGTTDHRARCCTCGNTVYGCPGHAGHIELPLPVYHGMYFDMVLKVLRTLCFWCARPKKRSATDCTPAPDTFTAHYNDCRFARCCEHCDAPQPHFTRSGCDISISWKGAALDKLTEAERRQTQLPFNPYVAHSIFTACSDEDWRSLGFFSGRPENMTPWTIVVPPPVIRPAIVNDAKCRGQDDLTHMLQAINKKAVALRALMEGTDPAAVALTVGHHGGTGEDEDDAAANDTNDDTDVEDADAEDAEEAEDADEADADADAEDAEDADNAEDADADAEADAEDADADADAERSRPHPSGAKREELAEAWDRLQVDVAALCNNTSRSRGQALQRSGAPTRTMKHRLCGKHGRLRENMMGKRTNQSARSVISPDPTLDLEEIGVPERLAKILTIPEMVNHGNLQEMTRRVRRGPGHIDGAATVITAEGRVIDLDVCPKERRMALRLRPAAMGRPGDVVERFLTDGNGDPDRADVVIFNRQPSLHKFSMMGHRVRILPGDTLRMNELAARPYNADFDGDEMNIHVPQSVAARAEVRELMMVSQLIMSPQGNRPVIGLVQDSLLGAYLLSDPAVRLPWSVAADILSHVRFPTRYRLPRRGGGVDARLTGRDLVTALLPRVSVSLPRRADDAEPFVIQDGEFLAGRLDKRSVGTGAGGVVHVICQEYGSPRAARFLSDLQSVVMRFLALRGFSMGIRDCLLSREGTATVKRSVRQCMRAADRILEDRDAYRGLGMTDEAEAAVTRVASAAISSVGKSVVTEMDASNALLTMITAGSKGNPVNYVQIIGCVGQNLVEGQRICASHERTLPTFVRNDSGLAAHGFVSNSYVDGLTPSEMFFHAMGGREGLVDTAVKTAVTGYLQRRTVKGLEEKAIGAVPHSARSAWRPVVSARRAVIQLRYGGDGCDGSRLERVALPLLTDGDAALRAWVQGDEADFAALVAARDRLIGGRDSLLGVDLLPHAYLPVSVARLVASVAGGEAWEAVAPGATAPAFVEATCTAVAHMMGEGASLPLAYTLRYWMCAAYRRQAQLPVEAVAWVCATVRQRVAAALVAPGEMVGIVTAQMIGEPLTQLTLNTFHLAGVGNQTQGIARVKELIDVTKKPKTPSVMLPLIPCLRDEGVAERFARALPRVTLGDLCASVALSTIDGAPPRAGAAMRAAASIELGDAAVGGLWMAVLTLDARRARACNMTPRDVARVVRLRAAASPEHGPLLFVAYGADHVSVAVRGAGLEPAQHEALAARVVTKLRAETVLGGVGGISQATVHRLSGSTAGGAYAATTVVRAADAELRACMRIGGVDWSRTYSDNVVDVLSVLGIEAARTVLLRELTRTICCDGTYIDSRHLSMLVDSMCARGYLMPMSRHGINRGARDETMKKCSYEETMEVLASAALSGHTDNMDGVTPSVAFGQHCLSMGTAAANVWYDRRQLWNDGPGRAARRATDARRLASSVVHRASSRAIVRGGAHGAQQQPPPPQPHPAPSVAGTRPVPLEPPSPRAAAAAETGYTPPSPRMD